MDLRFLILSKLEVFSQCNTAYLFNDNVMFFLLEYTTNNISVHIQSMYISNVKRLAHSAVPNTAKKLCDEIRTPDVTHQSMLLGRIVPTMCVVFTGSESTKAT
jgi:hypothetical protein